MNEPTPAQQVSDGPSRPWIIAGAIGFALVTLLMGIRWWSILAQPRPAPALRVVVLPLAVRDLAWAARADGLTREIARELETRPGLKVVSGGLVPQGVARGRDPRQIGVDFGAAWVLGGELTIVAGGVRLDLRLLRVEDGAEVWSTSAERESGELLGWPGEIAEKVAVQITSRAGLPDRGGAVQQAGPERPQHSHTPRHVPHGQIAIWQLATCPQTK